MRGEQTPSEHAKKAGGRSGRGDTSQGPEQGGRLRFLPFPAGGSSLGRLGILGTAVAAAMMGRPPPRLAPLGLSENPGGGSE